MEEIRATLNSRSTRSPGSQTGRKLPQEEEETLPPMTEIDRKTVEVLREKYVLSNAAVRRIMKGERLDDLISQGIIKSRESPRK